MARSGISKLEVRKARELLIADGKCASVDAVRQIIGNTGSKSTIHKYLKELEKESSTSANSRADTVRSIQNLVEELAASLHANVDSQIEIMAAKHEAARAAYEKEIEALQQKVALLTAELAAVEATGRRSEDIPDFRSRISHWLFGERPNSKHFGGMACNNRSGCKESTFFNVLNYDRSGAPAEIMLRPRDYA